MKYQQLKIKIVMCYDDIIRTSAEENETERVPFMFGS